MQGGHFMLGWKQSVSEFFMGNHAGLYNDEFISFTQVKPSKIIAFALLHAYHLKHLIKSLQS